MNARSLTPEQRRWVEQAAPRVAAMAKTLAYRVSHASFDELQSAGYEGLVQAAMRYDPASGVPFKAFAHYRVRGAMIDAARNAAPAIRRRSRALRALATTQSLLEQAHKKAIPGADVDKRSLQQRVAAAAELVAQTTTAVLLTKLPPKDPDSVGDDVALDAEQGLLKTELRQALMAEIDNCDAQERKLIEALYFEGRTMHDYATEVGKSVSTVSRHHAKLIGQLGQRLRRRLDGTVPDPSNS